MAGPDCLLWPVSPPVHFVTVMLTMAAGSCTDYFFPWLATRMTSLDKVSAGAHRTLAALLLTATSASMRKSIRGLTGPAHNAGGSRPAAAHKNTCCGCLPTRATQWSIVRSTSVL